jgi:hypothetical protein
MNEPDRNEDELLAELRGPLTAIRDSLGGVRMERPAKAIIAAGRSRKRRALALRTAAATAAAAVAASATVLLVGGAGQPKSPNAGIQAYTAAYVIGQVRSALADTDMVMQTTYSFSPPFPSITQWSYGGRFSMTQSGSRPPSLSPGTPWAHDQTRLAAGTAVIDGRLVYVVINYGLRQWYLASRQGVTPAGCSTRLDMVEFDGTVDWPSYLRQALSCGEFRYSGQATVDGRAAIKLTASVRGPSSWAEGPHPDRAWPHVDAALYVDPSTYVPLQVMWSNTGQSADSVRARGTIREDVSLLQPTPANIAKATVSVPAGFRRVHGSAFGGPVFQYFG